MKRFTEILREEEEKLLAEKTSWGRNDLKLLLEKAKNNALIRYLLEEKD